MYPLLRYATDPSSPESEVLLEEALRCWGVALAVAPAVPQPLLELLPRLGELLARGRDAGPAFQLVEAYLLLQVCVIMVSQMC